MHRSVIVVKITRRTDNALIKRIITILTTKKISMLFYLLLIFSKKVPKKTPTNLHAFPRLSFLKGNLGVIIELSLWYSCNSPTVLNLSHKSVQVLLKLLCYERHSVATELLISLIDYFITTTYFLLDYLFIFPIILGLWETHFKYKSLLKI